MRWLDSVFKLLLCAAALLVSSYLVYDAVVFRSRSMQIAQLLVAAHPLERAPPESLRRLLMIETGDHLNLLVARNLLLKLKVAPIARGIARDHLTVALWTSLVRLHLSEDEKITLLCSLSFLGSRAYGFQAAARSDFGRDLDHLDIREQALLVVYMRLPTRFRQPRHAESAVAARDALIHRMQ